MQKQTLRALLVAAVLATALTAAASVPAAPHGGQYTVTPLVSDVPGAAKTLDPNLVNGWGLTRTPTSPWWVADNGPGKSTLYTAAGTVNPLVVTVDGGPTGAVFAGIANNFPVATSATTTPGSANFVFASEDGQIRAWRGGTTALVTAQGGPGAVYKGLAIAQPTPGQPLLYATDFHNARVDVFNGAWGLVTPPGAFVDPSLPDGYAPFGIQTIGSRVFVTYAMQDADAHDEMAGESRGFVDAGRPFTQGNALLNDEERIAEYCQRDRHLHGDQDGADLVTTHGGNDGTKLHNASYCALSCHAG